MQTLMLPIFQFLLCISQCYCHALYSDLFIFACTGSFLVDTEIISLSYTEPLGARIWSQLVKRIGDLLQKGIAVHTLNAV